MEEKNPLKMKVTELKAELGRRGLSQTGLKFDLAQRLQTALDVEEFGVLPSLTNLSQPSPSPRLAPEPGKYSTNDGESSSQSPKETSCEFSKGQQPDEQPAVPEVAAETADTEGAKQSEQSQSLGTPKASIDSEGTTQPDTEKTPASKETFSTGKTEGDPIEVHGDGMKAKTTEIDILGPEEKPKISGERDIERGRDDIGGPAGEQSDSQENTTDAKDCVAVGKSTMPPSRVSCTDKDTSAAEKHPEATATGDAPLLPCLTKAEGPRTSPLECIERVQGPNKRKAGGGVEEPDETEGQTRGDEATPEDPEGVLSPPVIEGGHDASPLEKENQDGDPEVAPVSLPPCSQEERTKDKEDHSRPEENAEEEKTNDKKAEASAGRSGVPRGGATSGDDDRGRGGEAGGQHGVQAPVAVTVEDARRTKLLKRKKRFMTTAPTTSSGEEPSTNAGSTPSARKGPGETAHEMMSSELASTNRQAASEVAAKMARRSERFGLKVSGSRVPSPLRDPRGSFFAESEGMSEGFSEGAAKEEPGQIPVAPPGVGYYFDPLPQRQKRARAAPSGTEGETPTKRRGVKRVEAGVIGGESDKAKAISDTRASVKGNATSSDGAATPNQSGKQRHQTNKTGRPLPPSVSGGLTSPVSTPILLGARLEPKPSANVSTARNSGGASPIPSSSSSSSFSSRGGDEAMEASRRTTGWVGKGGKVPQQRIGKRAEVPEQPNGNAPPQAPHHYRSACPDEEAKQKVAAQAAKMAERRKRSHPTTAPCVLVEGMALARGYRLLKALKNACR